MKQAGVWSFRTATGVARVVDGSLRRRRTLYGLTVGNYKRRNWNALFRALGVGVSGISLFGPVRGVLKAIVGSGGTVSVLGVVSVAALLSMISGFGLSVFRRSTTIDIYDIVDVAVDADEAALGEAVSVLQLKGAPVDEALVEERA